MRNAGLRVAKHRPPTLEPVTLSAPTRSVVSRSVMSLCAYCGVGCGMEMKLDDDSDRVTKTVGRPDHPTNFGRLCTKGSTTADMLAAEAVFEEMDKGEIAGAEITSYTDKFKSSWVHKELYKVRNIRPGFHKGFWLGFFHAAFQTLGGWMLPYTLKNHADHLQTKPAAECDPIEYPKPDGVLTFDRLSSVFISDTNHEENQPSHLKLKDKSIPTEVNLPKYAGPSQRYCPAAVYEFVEGEFVINAQNCVHCKTCDIKDPSQNIVWTVPQGGGGPNYSLM